MRGRGPHLLRVAQEPARFAPLFAALAAAGLRCGWLELRQAGAPPASLEAAAALGAARAVATGEGRSVAVKALRGAPVLRDLLREHFAGCALVLVAAGGGGEAPAGAVAAAPELRAEGEGWRVTLPPAGGSHDGAGASLPTAEAADAEAAPAASAASAAVQHLDTPHLLARLRRPRPWAGEATTAAPNAPDPAGSGGSTGNAAKVSS
jgi:hypothetical protein